MNENIQSNETVQSDLSDDFKIPKISQIQLNRDIRECELCNQIHDIL